MADNRTKNVKVITPVGVFKFPRLGTPDTKFNDKGVYSVRLILSPEKAQPLIEKIDALQAEMFAAEQERLAADKAKLKKLKLAADKPYKAALDAEGEETGDFEFNFKLVAQYTDKKTNVTKRRKPDVVDSKGKPMDAEKVWGGSEGKIGGFLKPFNSPTVGVGVSLGLGAVQVFKLVSKGNSFDFGTNEGGYEDVEESSIGDNTANPSSTDAEEENTEF